MFELLLKLFRPSKRRGARHTACMVTLAVTAIFVWSSIDDASAQKWTGHRLVGPNEPPGAIGRKQLLGNKHRRGTIQPVRIDAPKSTWIAPAQAGSYGDAKIGSLQVGLQIGEVYRFKAVSAIGDYTVYPTVELIDRLYPPQGQEQRFPIPIELTGEELKLAAAGHFVTRVIYVEDPNVALPYRTSEDGAQEYFEVFPDQDPVAAAYGMGRPVAILRMGAKMPVRDNSDPGFTFGSPNVELYSDVPQPVSNQRVSHVAPASYKGPKPMRSPRLVRPPQNPLPLQ